jgi:hypothetical protein
MNDPASPLLAILMTMVMSYLLLIGHRVPSWSVLDRGRRVPGPEFMF